MSASMGLSLYPDNAKDIDTLLKQAGAGSASNDMFWLDPFTPEGARFLKDGVEGEHPEVTELDWDDDDDDDDEVI